MGNKPVVSEKHPQVSFALGVTTKEEAHKRNERFKELGINARHVEFKDGISPLEIYSNKGRNGALQELGLFDRDAGYGQHSGK